MYNDKQGEVKFVKEQSFFHEITTPSGVEKDYHSINNSSKDSAIKEESCYSCLKSVYRPRALRQGHNIYRKTFVGILALKTAAKKLGFQDKSLHLKSMWGCLTKQIFTGETDWF